MAQSKSLKYRLLTPVQKYVAMPFSRRLASQVLLETTGRKSGDPRVTPIGGRVIDGQFWLVSEHGEQSQYIRNIKADPAVRVRIRGRWHDGTAYLVPDDDPKARLALLPKVNSTGVRTFGTDLLSVRVELKN